MKKTVDIIERKDLLSGFFHVEQARLRHERFDGEMSQEIVRLNLDRGDSAAALVHDTEDDSIILTEQFRYPTFEKGPGWILELPAGGVEAGEAPEETVKRELLEEIGYSVDNLQFIATCYVSPGGTSERLHVYYAPVSTANKTSSGGGVPHEGEDIRVVRMQAQDAIAGIATGKIVDAKTILAVQWFQLNRRDSC